MFWSLFDHFWQKLLAVIWILLAGKESHPSWSHNSSVLLERQVGHPRTLQDRRGWVWFPIAPRGVYSPSLCSLNSRSWFRSKLQKKISTVFKFETFSSVNSLGGGVGTKHIFWFKWLVPPRGTLSFWFPWPWPSSLPFLWGCLSLRFQSCSCLSFRHFPQILNILWHLF